MSAQEQIGKLQGLLARIQRNTGQPRVSAPVVTTAAATPTAAADQSVDDLLDASPAPSPLPVDVDIALDSVPPAEAEPIPLVASGAGAAPPAAEDSFGLDSEVSEVRVTTAMREPVEEVTVAAIEAEAEPEPASEELSEDDLVEVTDVTSIPPGASSDVDIDFDDEDEQPPASSQRSKVASSMDEALAAAAEQLDAEREVPLKTPPPESGPQAAPMPPVGAPAAPDVDALLGQELDIPTRAEQSRAAAGPTTEQLGQTIDLEEPRGPSLELAEQRGTARPAPAAVEELEVALPGRDVVGSYDDNLQPPPEARQELEAHRRRQEDDIAPPPESLAQLPSMQPAAPQIIPAQAAAPEVVARPVPVGSPEAFGSVRESFRPRAFVELLDASLALHGD